MVHFVIEVQRHYLRFRYRLHTNVNIAIVDIQSFYAGIRQFIAFRNNNIFDIDLGSVSSYFHRLFADRLAVHFVIEVQRHYLRGGDEFYKNHHFAQFDSYRLCINQFIILRDAIAIL